MKYTYGKSKKTLLALAITSLVTSPLVFASDLNISGFISVGGGFVDDADSLAYSGFSDEELTIKNNLLGLQVTGKVSDKLTATAQLIARSSGDYSVNTEWAYLTWQATDSTKVRFGRLRTPFYNYSDSLDVGYTYPWIRPPQEVYSLPFNNVDGIDVYTTHTLGMFDTSFQAYFGSFDDEVNFSGVMAPTKTRNQIGMAATLGKDWWTLRGAFHQADLTVDVRNAPLTETLTMGGFADTLTAFNFPENSQKLLLEEDTTTFAQVGINIDTGTFVAALEHTELEAKDSLLAKRVREYVMGGVRFGDWLVHLTFAKSADETSHPEAGIPAGVALPQVGSTNFLIGVLQGVAQSQVEERDVITLGTRWDITSGTALKFQIDDVDDIAGNRQQKVFSFALQSVF